MEEGGGKGREVKGGVEEGRGKIVRNTVSM